MACACNKKWLVVNSAGKVVHRTDTQDKAKAAADRNGDTKLRVLHESDHRKEQAAARAAKRSAPATRTTPTTSTTQSPLYEVVTRSGRVLSTTTNRTRADDTARRFANVGATVRPKAAAAPTR